MYVVDPNDENGGQSRYHNNRDTGGSFTYHRFICIKCNCTRSARKDTGCQCPHGHGEMAWMDPRLRVPKKRNTKGWKKFWSYVKIW